MKKFMIKMKFMNRAITVMLFMLVGFAGKAQYDAMFTQYMFNEMFINPAYAGSKEAMAVNLLHRQQWLNFPGRPVTTTFSLHGPLMNNKMGLGISVLNERIGKLNRNLLYASYAYRVKTDKKGTLALGLNAGIHNQVNRLSELKATDDGDIQISQNTPTSMAPNFGFGVYYNTNKFYAGVSIPRMIDDGYMFDNSGAFKQQISFNISKFHYYITTGYVFEINEDLRIKPQAMIKVVANAPVQYEVNTNCLIKNMIWAGLSYRSGSNVAAILGCQVNPQFIVSYSYDYGLNAIQKYSQGSHELALGYLFSYKQKSVITPRYF
jgi:type IX secretion system PorP/SprF family membrane protein